jgi:N-acetyl-gamma-glutamyl-phosphate reductase
MQTAAIGIIGASGYSGLVASRILALHPRVMLRFLGSDRWAGESAASRADLPGEAGKLVYLEQSGCLAAARKCDAVLLATPVEASLRFVPALLDAGVRAIDLSGAFRLRDPALYERHYGFKHPHPALLAEAVYGLPELFPVPEGTRFVANPGCYPTAASLALLPLVEAGLLHDSPLIVDAASGVTGAGRKASEDFSFAEMDGDFRAYKVLRHQHQPEIAQALRRPLTFTAHLLPIRRGILATCYARVCPGVSPANLMQAFMHKYAQAPFVRVADSPDAVALRDVVGTNFCNLSAASDGETAVVISAIDNLVKGAAGQAVQNLNAIFGWPQTTGLDTLRGSHP